MGYLYILIASLAVGGQFSLSKVYKNSMPQSGYTDLFYNFALGLFSVVIFAIVCMGRVGFNAFSVSLATIIAVANIIYQFCGLKAVMYGKLSVFTTFLMLGGMIFPALYGIIFLKEQVSGFKIAGIVLLVLSMLFSLTEKTEKGKTSFMFYLLCFIAFICNGAVSVFSKKHQIGEGTLNTLQFTFWQAVVITVVTGALLVGYVFLNRRREGLFADIRKTVGGKSLGLILAITAIMRLGSVALLLAAKSLPASLLYPFVTGATILITAIFGRIFFKEKISRINLIVLLTDLVATALMIF